jgi:plastocyanin
MSRMFSLAAATALLLIVSACSSGASTAAPASAPASAATSESAAAPSESAAAPSESAPASESAAAAAGCAASTDTGTVTATIKNFAFDPATITAKVGDVVTWTNDDSAAHTATLKTDESCSTGTISAGSSGGIQFTAAGTYDYFCKIHPTMTGKVEVS